MKKLNAILLLCLCSNAQAYNNLPLTPSWFKHLHQGISENKKDVWRGTIINSTSPTTIIVKNLKGKEVTVELLHLTTRKNPSERDINLSQARLINLIGKQVYVLSSDNKSHVSAKILDGSGKDINLGFVEAGTHDINTTSLIKKRERQQYVNARNTAINAQVGIWTNQ